jgi:hypothetical protein
VGQPHTHSLEELNDLRAKVLFLESKLGAAPIAAEPQQTLQQTLDQMAVRADAQRYRWLRDKSQPGICTFYLSVGNGLHGVRFTRETVDEAIDAQIDAKEDVSYTTRPTP